MDDPGLTPTPTPEAPGPLDRGRSGPVPVRSPAGRYRDPTLARMLREARQHLGVTAKGLARVAWDDLGIPLSVIEIHRLERAARHPTAWHLSVYLRVLRIPDTGADVLIRRWAMHSRCKASPGLSLESWASFLEQEDPPLPTTRRARPERLHSDKGGPVSGTFKLRLTPTEDVLVEKTAKLLGYTVSNLVRTAMADAVEHRRSMAGRPAGPDETKTREHNIRLSLDPATIDAINGLSHGVELAPWARLVVLDFIESGRATQDLARVTGPADVSG